MRNIVWGVVFVTLCVCCVVGFVGSLAYMQKVERDIVAAYQFDWIANAVEHHLRATNGSWPKSWTDVEQSLAEISKDGSCPWSAEEIQQAVIMTFEQDGEVSLSSNEVDTAYVRERVAELRQLARSLSK